MSFPEKVDVLDLLINILREHEKKFDELVSRLEEVVDKLARLEKLIEAPETISPCDGCTYARGLGDGLVMNPGDNPGDCVWCTCNQLIEERDYEAREDERYGYGTLLYKVGVMEKDDSCDYMEAS